MESNTANARATLRCQPVQKLEKNILLSPRLSVHQRAATASAMNLRILGTNRARVRVVDIISSSVGVRLVVTLSHRQ